MSATVGTALGDPIEVGALRHVYTGGNAQDLTTTLLAFKTNIGHLEPGAGLAGLIKCHVLLQRSFRPPNLHLRTLNPHLDVHGFPVIIPTATTSYDLPEHRAAVSSFGYGGTNAHALLAPPPDAAARPGPGRTAYCAYTFRRDKANCLFRRESYPWRLTHSTAKPGSGDYMNNHSLLICSRPPTFTRYNFMDLLASSKHRKMSQPLAYSYSHSCNRWMFRPQSNICSVSPFMC